MCGNKTVIIFCLCLCLLFPITALSLPVEIGGVAACVMDAGGAVLMEQEAQKAVDTAGLMRLPALLCVCEAADRGELELTQRLRVSEAAAAVGGPTAFLTTGEEILAGDLYKSAVMIMAGDAIFALSEAVLSSDEAFVESVNARLAALGVAGRCTDRMGTKTQLSAADVALLGAALSQSGTFLTYSGMYYDTIVHDSGLVTEMASANKLLKSCSGCNGGATGSSDTAGYCGVYMATREGTTYICAVLGAANAKERAQAAKTLLEYAFATFQTEQLARRGEVIVGDVPVENGVENACDLIAAADVRVVLPQNGAYSEKSDIPVSLTAPVRAGEVLGNVTYLDADGGILAKVELTVREDIAASSWRDRLSRVVRSFLHM
ncbi:MAG: hypothetical protein PHC80_05455 [Eubacteriales bacterium]|nr:hypothetical protein [Eubacteriales bacterium]